MLIHLSVNKTNEYKLIIFISNFQQIQNLINKITLLLFKDRVVNSGINGNTTVSLISLLSKINSFKFLKPSNP